MKVVMETGPFYLVPSLCLPTPPPFLLLNSYFVSLPLLSGSPSLFFSPHEHEDRVLFTWHCRALQSLSSADPDNTYLLQEQATDS